MPNPEPNQMPSILLKNNGLIKVSNSIQVTNKLLDEYAKRQLAPKVKSVIIGTQEWMVENLNVDHFRNGDIILEGKDKRIWAEFSDGQKPHWCYYDNDAKYSHCYGKIYNWTAVNDPRGLAPLGWHIPSGNEWRTLIKFLGSNSGKKMKSKSNWNGTNKSLFNGLPCGERGEKGEFKNLGKSGKWWTSTSYLYFNNGVQDLSLPYYPQNNCFFIDNILSLNNDSNIANIFESYGQGYYVRCIKD